MRIVFMGTPDFAVPCLERLISDGENVVGVFSQPDKPKGRGHILTPPPVKECALTHNIPVFQPVKMKSLQTIESLKELNPDLIIVVAYGKILQKEILEMPKYGCINIHASLLPKYRGAAPIQWAVLNGEIVSGVTAMQMDEGLDTGDMLLKAQVEIGDNDTAEDLHDKLSVLGAEVMSKTIAKLKLGELIPEKQPDEEYQYASMLSKDMCPVDWNKSAKEIHNQIRGLYSWPMATTLLDGKTIKIHSSKLSDMKSDKTGEVIFNDKKLVVACGDGNAIEITKLQAEGKKAMSAESFMLGRKIEIGTRLG